MTSLMLLLLLRGFWVVPCFVLCLVLSCLALCFQFVFSWRNGALNVAPPPSVITVSVLNIRLMLPG